MLSLALLALAVSAAAQNCSQYAPANGTSSCFCPPGFAGADCSLPACGGNLFQGSSRQTSSNVSSCACDSGWSGNGCTLATTANACGTAYNATGMTSSPSASPLSADQVSNQTMLLSASPRVFAASQMTCDVLNPTVQSVLPRRSQLSISRTLTPSLSPIPNITAVGEAGSVFAQYWYEGVEQFYCQATNCNQTLTPTSNGNSSEWACNSLRCTCREGTDFCTGLPLAPIINGLSGELNIDCDATGGTCSFKQQLLVNFFGSSGIALTGCTFSECVTQNSLDVALGTSTLATVAGSSLSPGVIGGLAAVGAIVFLALLGLLWGLLARRRARRAPRTDESRRGVGVAWTGVSYAVRKGKVAGTLAGIFGGSGKKVKYEGVETRAEAGSSSRWKQVLAPSSGQIEPGRLVAVLGPSGAGKSTLVDILAGRRKAGRSGGKVSFFSTQDSRGDPDVRPRVGYVDQSDVHAPTSTVREALLFAARLRLPDNVPEHEKEERVDLVLTQLGLTDIASSRIGDGLRRGISGGEMRRVSIGLELVGKPDVLFLDEPTSGLDSVAAAKVVAVLHDLAHDPVQPTTIIASIHQPSSKLYFTFDNVLLLSHGRSLYYGPGGSAPVDHFVQQGAPGLPVGYNVADYLLEIASDGTTHLLPESSDKGEKPKLRSTDSTFGQGGKGSSREEIPLGELHRRPQPMHRDTSYRTEDDGDTSVEPLTAVSSNQKPSYRPQAAFITQFFILCGREWRTLKRDFSLFFAHTFVAAVAGAFAGGIYFQVDTSIAGFQNRIGALFFLGSLIAFSSLSALYNLIEIRPLFLRERSSSYYSPSAWLLARCIFDIIPLRIIPTTIVSTILYWMVGLSPKPAEFFKFLLILILYSLGLTLFNFLVAVVIRSAGIAILFSSIVNLYLMTFAGFFVNLSKIPDALRWLQYFDTLKYALEAISVNEVGSGLLINDTLSGVTIQVNAELIMALLFGFSPTAYYRDVIVLFIFLLGYLVLLVLAVWFFLREMR